VNARPRWIIQQVSHSLFRKVEWCQAAGPLPFREFPATHGKDVENLRRRVIDETTLRRAAPNVAMPRENISNRLLKNPLTAPESL
jgi:hypothetical protein